jgi:transcriptional regulator with XRE-family HTH domain
MIRIDPDRIGPAIGELRRLLGLTQVALAEEAGIFPSQLSHWEHEDRRPDLASLVKVARALGYDLALIPREGA